MKCLKCGAPNPDTSAKCHSCGGALALPETQGQEGTTTDRRPAPRSGDPQTEWGLDAERMVNHRDIARKVRFDYAVAARDETSKGLDAVCSILTEIENSRHSIRSFMDFCANLIARQFGLKEVSIGLKSDTDGMYRYVSVVGSNEIAERKLREIAYSREDFRLNGNYRGTSLSRYSTLFLAEDNPYVNGEEITYSHPVLLKSERKSATECVEGDYIDTYIFGEKDELVGWIEISGTRAGNLPNVRTIKWIEAVSKMIGFALSQAEFTEDGRAK